MKLSGIELRYFRSIGAEPVLLNPLKKCNILVGQNNIGKSNVLKAVKKLSDWVKSPETNTLAMAELDGFQRSREKPFLVRLIFDADYKEKLDTELVQATQFSRFWFDIAWFNDRGPGVINNAFTEIYNWQQANIALELLAGHRWNNPVSQEQIQKEFNNMGKRIFAQHFASHVPDVYIIPEFRQIKEGDGYSFDGTGLVNLLASFQLPEIGQDKNQQKFEQIQQFMRHLLHLPEAILEVSRNNPTIIIKNDGLRLPISSFGTGVHELLILVTAVLSIQNALWCIEEPEIHLHPRLQREFIDFLITETTNQYLLSSHSPTLINLIDDGIQVFHLWRKDDATVGSPVFQNDGSIRAVRDIGLKASDLLQANCIIWVEGLSDQVYVQRWLELIAPDLIDGRDFIFMPYKKLPSLYFGDAESLADEVINVLQINQNAIVIIDSDRKAESDILDAAKKRMKEQCENNGGLCWITDGSEIENYLPPSVIRKACKDLRNVEIDITLKPFDDFEKATNGALKKSSAQLIEYSHRGKLDYSKKFAEHISAEDITEDIRERINAVATKIRDWRA